MIFWNYLELATKINNISEREKLSYYLFTIAFYFCYHLLLINSSYTKQNIILHLTCFLLDVFICFRCYKINSLGDNKNFIERYVCLGVPIYIRSSVFSLIIFLVIYFGQIFYYNIKGYSVEGVVNNILEDAELISYILPIYSVLYSFYHITKGIKVSSKIHD
jgi:hypothetical protein